MTASRYFNDVARGAVILLLIAPVRVTRITYRSSVVSLGIVRSLLTAIAQLERSRAAPN